MATQYVMPPSYRAGRADPKLGAVRDVLAFLEFVSGQHQEEQDAAVKDAKWYNRQNAEDRADVRKEERLEARRIAQEDRLEQRLIDQEKRKVAPGGVLEQEYALKAKYDKTGDIETHNKGLMASYDLDELETDSDGWMSVKAGGLSRIFKAEAVEALKNVVGEDVGEYGEEKYTTLATALSHGATSMGPKSYNMTRHVMGKSDTASLYEFPGINVEDEIDRNYWAGSNIDQSPGLFTSHDVEQELKNLSRDLAEDSDTSPDALGRAFRAGLSSNKFFMGDKEFQDYKESSTGETRTQKTFEENITVSQQARRLSTKEDVKKDQETAYTAADQLFNSVANNIFKLETGLGMVTTKSAGAKINALNNPKSPTYAPELYDAANFLFMQGSNVFEPGSDPKPYTSYEEWFGKFMYLDKPGRGGSPSVAERLMDAMGMQSVTPLARAMIEGTHFTQTQGKFRKDEKTLTDVYDYTMSTPHLVARAYEVSRPSQPYSEADKVWGQFKFSPSFMKILDGMSDRGGFSYGYKVNANGQHLPILKFADGDTADNFLQTLFTRSRKIDKSGNLVNPVLESEVTRFHESWQSGLIEFEW